MPLEVREFVVNVDVGAKTPTEPRRLSEHELAVLKREVVEACLIELRQYIAAREER